MGTPTGQGAAILALLNVIPHLSGDEEIVVGGFLLCLLLLAAGTKPN